MMNSRPTDRLAAGVGRLRFERLEERRLLAGDTYLINCQLAGSNASTRFLTDTGQVYADRGSGLADDWSSDQTDVRANARESGSTARVASFRSGPRRRSGSALRGVSARVRR